MKKSIMLALGLCLLTVSPFAAETLLDSCGDVNYATAVSDGGETIVLTTDSTSSTEGGSSLSVAYTHTAQAIWGKNTKITKTFASPVDLTGMEYLALDVNCTATVGSGWYFQVYMLDETGSLFRASYSTALDAVSGGWTTLYVPLSSMDNTEWEGPHAVNLKKVTQISYRIQNDGAVSAGTLTFSVDNLRFVNGTDSLNEVMLEDFESYADDAALASAWGPSFKAATASLETSDPYAGAQSMIMDASIPAAYNNFGRAYTFSTTQDFSAVQYIKLAMKGDTAMSTYNPTAHLFLEDAAGNRAASFIWYWPGQAEWTEMFLTFKGKGIAASGVNCIWREDAWDAGGNVDLTQIKKMHLDVEFQAVGAAFIDIVFDNIVLGYVANEGPPQASVKSIDVGKTSIAPTLDGTVSAGEWSAAGSEVATGFVHHDNNALAATEDPQVKVMYDDTYLYICYQVVNASFAQDFSPNSPGDDVNSSGDKFPIFLTPNGNMGSAFYRISFVPNPGDGTLYIWDEAGLTSGYPGVASWNADNDSGDFSYDSGSGLLTMEYRIPWTDFDLTGNVVTGAPADSAQWGAQFCFSNNDPAEYVNWEPDSTGGYVNGRPFGTLTFAGTNLSVDEWTLY